MVVGRGVFVVVVLCLGMMRVQEGLLGFILGNRQGCEWMVRNGMRLSSGVT